MKNALLRLTAVVLTVTVMFSFFSFPASADTVNAYAKTSQTPVRVTAKTGVLGMHVYVNGAFDSVSFVMPTWSVSGQYDATLAVYAWNQSVNKTLEAEPLAQKCLTALVDNATNSFSFDALEKGEYFICIRDTTGSVGCYVSGGNTTTGGYMFSDSAESADEMFMTIGFVGAAPETPFLPVKSVYEDYGEAPVYEEITEDLRDLSSYNLPSDSLYLQNEAKPDTWYFTDGLGRKALTYDDVGPVREDKTTVLFYSPWHASFAASSTPFNVQQYLDEQEANGVDISTILYDYSYWPSGSYQNFWNEPIWGYYSTADEWVLRKQAQLLADAGIDAISCDNTNGTHTWKNSYDAIFQTWGQAQKDGVNAPKVSFMLPFGAGSDMMTQLKSLYTDFYRDGKYRSLWFYFDGKPFIMTAEIRFNVNDVLEREYNDFFTVRYNHAGYKADSTDVYRWGWLSTYPQMRFYKTKEDKQNGVAEEITVGAAQNWNTLLKQLAAMNNPNNAGRSFTRKNGYDTRTDSKLWGANLSEQFTRALSVDPRVIYITGWNEWIAGRYETWPEGSESAVSNAFPDEFNDENSRDIEPSRGDLKDHYYYQMVNYIRQYKGVSELAKTSVEKTIDITASVSQWADVAYQAGYIGDTGDRDCNGYVGYYYTDKSGRNDIIGTQTARDDEYLYILVECASDITSYTDPLWMNVYLDTDGDSFGWESFDYVINKTTPKDENTAVLERFTGNGYETETVADVAYSVQGRYLQIAVKKSDLGLSGDTFDVHYSVTDNVHDRADEGTEAADGSLCYTAFTGDILDFYTSGDVEPGGRFQFTFAAVESAQTTTFVWWYYAVGGALAVAVAAAAVLLLGAKRRKNKAEA